MRRTTYLLPLFLSLSSEAAALDDSGHFARQVVCLSGGGDVLLELYLPHPVVYENAPMDNPKSPVSGFFALDLEKLGKGKSIEPVKVWRDMAAGVLVVDRYSRGLPIARVPLGGGITDFDDRFAQSARCKPYGETREDEMGVDFPPPAPEPDEARGDEAKPR